jgi:hypothetical protein
MFVFRNVVAKARFTGRGEEQKERRRAKRTFCEVGNARADLRADAFGSGAETGFVTRRKMEVRP